MRKMPKVQSCFNILLTAYIFSFAVEKLFILKTSIALIYLPELLFIPLSIVFLGLIPKFWRDRHNLLSKWLVFDTLVVGYWAVVLLSYCLHSSYHSLSELVGCTYMVVFYFIFNLYFLINERGLWLEKCLKLFIYFGIIASIISIGSYILGILGVDNRLSQTNDYYPLIGDTLRSFGLFRNPIFHANYLASTLIVFASVYFEEIKKLNMRFWLLLLLFAIAIFLTKTKSILIVFSIGCYYISQLWQIKKLPRYTLYSLGVLSSVAYIFLSHFLIIDVQLPHLAERLDQDYYFPQYIWHITDGYAIVPTFYYGSKRAAILAFFDFFPFGVGGDNLATYVDTLVAQGRHYKPFCCAPHSTFFGALGELGILGFGFVVALFTKTWQMAISFKENDLVIPHINLMAKSLLFFLTLEAITVDLMNVRHVWLILAVFALVFRLNIKNEKSI